MSEQTSQQDQAQPEVSPPSQKAEPQQERGGEGQPSPGLRNSKGWDGKLRVEKTAVLANPEVLSDPEASDDSNVIPGEQLPADEGRLIMEAVIHGCRSGDARGGRR